MNDSRYAPPVAPVADAAPAQIVMTRPRQVVLAVQLAAVNCVLGLAVLAVSWDYYTRLLPARSLILSQAFNLAVLAWLYSKVYAGRNWARITLLVVSLIGMLFMFNRTFVAILKAAPLIVPIQMIVGVVVSAVILWMLFLSPGREWFKKRR
jgi:hypothetical protein